jgi:dTDP-4-amino-4,6-dideoxygalactose transaminase
LGFQVQLPATERLFQRCLMLPMNTSLSDADVEYVGQVIRRFYAECSARRGRAA